MRRRIITITATIIITTTHMAMSRGGRGRVASRDSPPVGDRDRPRVRPGVGDVMRIIFDGHLDLSWNALSWGRDITMELDGLNAGERAWSDHPARGRATTTLPEMRRGA